MAPVWDLLIGVTSMEIVKAGSEMISAKILVELSLVAST